LLERFLHDFLDYSWDEVHDEAERLEHFISERLEDRIAAKLGDPETDPHGVVNARLFLGHLVNHDDQQDHYQYSDHRPNPHPSAHPSVSVVHHMSLSFVLRRARPWSIQTVSGGVARAI
jgi:hypothetical protein